MLGKMQIQMSFQHVAQVLEETGYDPGNAMREKGSLELVTQYKHKYHDRSNSLTLTQVLEETGYDLGDALREEDSVEVHIGQKRTKLYIVGGVDEATHFAPQVRKARRG